MRDDALSVVACGSSAAVGLPGYLSWLRQEIDLSLRVLLTRGAERFVVPQAIGWYADELYTSDDPALNPIELARRSLGIVVLPATANMLAAAALGLAMTPAQTVLLASERPVLLFPQMNPVMWAKPVVQRHVAALRAAGHTVVQPTERVVFELWQRRNATNPALPPPDQATELVISWLEDTVPGEPEPAGPAGPAAPAAPEPTAASAATRDS